MLLLMLSYMVFGHIKDRMSRRELLRSASNSSSPPELQSLPLTPPLRGHQNQVSMNFSNY